MEPGNTSQTPEQEDKFANLKKVTPLSKYLAMSLFIVMPFIGGWIGYNYAPEKVMEVEKTSSVSRVTIEEVENINVGKGSYCNHYARFEVDDGYLVFDDHKTQLPASLCSNFDLFSLEGESVEDLKYTFYTGESKNYFIRQTSFSDPEPDSLSGVFTYADLGDFDITNVERIGTTTEPFLFTNGKEIIRIDYGREELVTGPAYSLLYAKKIPVYSKLSTFKLISPSYSKDSKKVYYKDREISADPESFDVIIDSVGGFESSPISLAKDSYSVWFEDRIIMYVGHSFEMKLVEVGLYGREVVFDIDGKEYVYSLRYKALVPREDYSDFLGKTMSKG